MDKPGDSIFNPIRQEHDLDSKIIISLERISEVFRMLLWRYGKKQGLSPIQIQIILFIGYHQQNICTISDLSKEFSLTKATISDAVSTLVQKKLIRRKPDKDDRRVHQLVLTVSGKAKLEALTPLGEELLKPLDQLGAHQKGMFLGTLLETLKTFSTSGLIDRQRMCLLCDYYFKKKGAHYCNLLQLELKTSELRVDCNEFSRAI